jgi:hypothetical protein
VLGAEAGEGVIECVFVLVSAWKTGVGGGEKEFVSFVT